jgi:hypothetical protein
VIVRLIIQDTDAGLRATLNTQNDPGDVESKSSEAFLVKTKAEARKKASDLARHHGLKTYRVLDKTLKVIEASGGA